MDLLRRLDRGWARLEGWVTVGVLILMVFAAGWQAFVRNLTRFDIEWANEMLNDMGTGIDSLLRKGTLWLAFLGASLATHKHKHIGIDILLRIAPGRAKYVMVSIGSLLSGIIAIGLTVSFSQAVYLNLTERPLEYELLAADGDSIHSCDASEERLEQFEDFDKPVIFCAVRSVLATLGIPAETPGAAFQLIVPVMFVSIAVRLIGRGFGAVGILLGGDEAIEQAEADERRRIRADQEAAASMGSSATKDEGGRS